MLTSEERNMLMELVERKYLPLLVDWCCKLENCIRHSQYDEERTNCLLYLTSLVETVYNNEFPAPPFDQNPPQGRLLPFGQAVGECPPLFVLEDSIENTMDFALPSTSAAALRRANRRYAKIAAAVAQTAGTYDAPSAGAQRAGTYDAPSAGAQRTGTYKTPASGAQRAGTYDAPAASAQRAVVCGSAQRPAVCGGNAQRAVVCGGSAQRPAVCGGGAQRAVVCGGSAQRPAVCGGGAQRAAVCSGGAQRAVVCGGGGAQRAAVCGGGSQRAAVHCSPAAVAPGAGVCDDAAAGAPAVAPLAELCDDADDGAPDVAPGAGVCDDAEAVADVDAPGVFDPDRHHITVRGGNITPTVKTREPRNPPPDGSNMFYNAYEDPEEIAKVIARSKGQDVREFVAAVSRYTRDNGQALEAAMKAESSRFRDSVENISSQYIKDLSELLDEQQSQELQEIRKDTEKWQIELSNIKRRIGEMIPNFDVELYRKDPNYIRKMFSFSISNFSPQEDPFKKYKDESSDRLKAIKHMIKNVAECNNQAKEDLDSINTVIMTFQAREVLKQQNVMKCLQNEIEEYRRMRAERDKLFQENSELQAQLEEMGV